MGGAFDRSVTGGNNVDTYTNVDEPKKGWAGKNKEKTRKKQGEPATIASGDFLQRPVCMPDFGSVDSASELCGRNME